MRVISLFDGIGTAQLAFGRLGWECVATSEISAFANAVTSHHFPGVPNLGDITAITQEMLDTVGPIDMVFGGFPCQDLSVAGNRRGLEHNGETTRSGLFFNMARIADQCNARWVVAENVPGLFSSSAGRDFASVVGTLSGVGVGVPAGGWRNSGVLLGPRGIVEWATLDAQYFGLAQRRKRVFIVRDSGDWTNRSPIFLERESVCGDHPTRRQAGQDIAASLTRGADSGGRGGYAGRRREDDVNIVSAYRTSGNCGAWDTGDMVDALTTGTDPNSHIIAGTMESLSTAGGFPGTDAACDGYVVPIAFAQNQRDECRDLGDLAGALANQPGMKQQTYVAYAIQERAVSENVTNGPQGKGWNEETAFTLEARHHQQSVAYGIHSDCLDRTGEGAAGNAAERAGLGITEELSPCLNAKRANAVAYQCQGTNVGEMGTLRSGNGNTAGGVPFMPMAFTQNQCGDVLTGDVMCSIGTSSNATGRNTAKTMDRHGVRRLTPRECERLQGLPDDWTNVTYRGKPAADGPRYQAIGNGMAVPVVAWICHRIVGGPRAAR